MPFRLALLLLLVPAARAQGTVVLAGGGSEGNVGNTSAWSYRLYGALVENGDVDGDGTVRVAVVSRLPETQFIPNYFEWIGTTLGLAVEAFNVEVATRVAADDPSVVGPVATADAAFLKGGDQGRYYDLWNDTLLETHLHALAAEGGALGGTSAGAMSLAEHCLCGGRDLVSSDPLADAHTLYLNDLSEPGTSGIHSDFLGVLAGTFVDSHFTERGRLGRLLGVLAKVTDDTGDDAILAIGVEAQTGLIVRRDTALVVGEGAVEFVQQTAGTRRFRDAGRPLVYTDLRLDRLTDGWRYALSARAPVTDELPPDAEPVVYAGDGPSNDGALTVFGNVANDRGKFEWVATYYPEPYTLTATPAPTFVRDAVGFTHVFRNDDLRGDRQEILFRALYDRPNLSAFFLFGPGSGASGGTLVRTAEAPDVAHFEGDVAGIVVDGKPLTHRGLAPEENYYRVRSAALVGARAHVLAESGLRGISYDTRTRALVGPGVASEPGPGTAADALDVWPNPATGGTEVRVRLSHAERVRVEVLDVLGRRVLLLHDGPLPSGEGARLAFDASRLPSGVYTVRAVGAGVALAERLTVAR